MCSRIVNAGQSEKRMSIFSIKVAKLLWNPKLHLLKEYNTTVSPKTHIFLLRHFSLVLSHQQDHSTRVPNQTTNRRHQGSHGAFTTAALLYNYS